MPPLRILHVNDTEGDPFVLWPRLAATLRRLRDSEHPDVLLHAGDLPLDGAAAATIRRTIGELNFDAVALGNHDISAETPNLIADLSIPVLCANLQTTLWPGLQGYRWIERAGRRIAVIGVTLPDLQQYVPARYLPSSRLLTPQAAVEPLLNEVRSFADLVVVVSHAGLEYDMALAREIKGIDLIVSGHDHAILAAPIIIGTTMIVQAASYGAAIGIVTIAEGYRVWGQIPVDSVPPDPEIVRYVADMHQTADDSVTDRLRLSVLIGDCLRAAGGADLALTRCAAVHPPPMQVFAADALLPYVSCSADQLVCVRLTGAAIRATLEQGAREAYYLLALSGAQVDYDLQRPPGVRVLQVHCGAELLHPERVYTVACSEVLANGVGGFPLLAAQPSTRLTLTIAEAVQQYWPSANRRL